MSRDLKSDTPVIVAGVIVLLIIVVLFVIKFAFRLRGLLPPPRGTVFNLNSPATHAVQDEQDRVRHVEHIREFGVSDSDQQARAVAARYVTANARAFGIPRQWLELERSVGAPGKGSKLRFDEERTAGVTGETTVITYGQTLNGLPVWEAGIAVVVSRYVAGRMRVTSAQSTLQFDLQVGQPQGAGPPLTPEMLTTTMLDGLLGLGLAPEQPPVRRINWCPRLLYYRYDDRDGARCGWTPVAAGSQVDEELVRPRQVLPLPHLPSPAKLRPGRLYKVIEVLFTAPLPPLNEPHMFSDANVSPTEAQQDGSVVHWRAFIEPVTGTVVYLRPAAAACFGEMFSLEAPAAAPGMVTATGTIFKADPVTLTGADPFAPGQNPTDPTLNPQPITVNLANVVAVPTGQAQGLYGKYVRLAELYSPVISLPAANDLNPPPPPPPFDFSALPVTHPNRFTAVNAYYHFDAMFRMLEQLNLLDTFFPSFKTMTLTQIAAKAIRIDPQGMANSIDALTTGDESFQRVDRIFFGRGRKRTYAAGEVAYDVGNALDVRVVLHEFAHVLMWPILRSPNFSFAHSAGDSLAAILHDPCSQVPAADRYQTFPWLMRENSDRPNWPWRHHGGPTGDVATWAWGGTIDRNDNQYQTNFPGYKREQILSTTLFRVYKALGGDAIAASAADDVRARNVRYLAARYMAYLIIRGIAGLPSSHSVPTHSPDAYAAALMEADTVTPSYTDPHFPASPIPGGTAHKVIRWGFERQGLYQPPGAPRPVTQAGQPPVDLHIGPGAYEPYQDNYFETADLWNHHSAADNTVHEEPQSGVLNQVFVRLRNRGYEAATGVVLRGYYRAVAPPSNPPAPEDLQAPDLTWQRPPAGSWTEMTPAGGLPVGTISPTPPAAPPPSPLGPLTWMPPADGHYCLLVTVSATSDPSNIDPNVDFACAAGPTPLWRLVPFDNNLAARRVVAAP